MFAGANDLHVKSFKVSLKCVSVAAVDQKARVSASPAKKMAIIRQFGLLLWKNYLQQVGWKNAHLNT